MCYPKPGPRCSSHARERLRTLQEAKASVDDIKEATKEYLETPEGIRKLRNAGRTDLASAMLSRRKKKIDDYNQRKKNAERLDDEEYLDWATETAMAHLSEEFDEDYARNTVSLLRSFQAKGYPMLGGRTRVAFDDGEKIIKVPITGEGLLSCGQEVQLSKTEDAYIPMADTKWRDTENGLSYTLSEKVKPYNGDINVLPSWTWSVDCFQVGHTRDGRLVAYDL